ncbi:MAG: type II toxin-antitoxin system VapC family toxin [Deltaproteobacteria bacterium]|nr:type II toxin-antitoxin system VapC family toxin [Deltaproteobacteria bacterium]
MSRLCLDTSAYSHFRRGHSRAVEVITSARSIFVPSVVLGELRAGFKLGRRAAENDRALSEFLAAPVVEILDVDDEAASHYADLVVSLRKSGTPLPTSDIWIAAVALREGATIVTYDGHFSEMRRVGVLLLSL